MKFLSMCMWVFWLGETKYYNNKKTDGEGWNGIENQIQLNTMHGCWGIFSMLYNAVSDYNDYDDDDDHNPDYI